MVLDKLWMGVEHSADFSPPAQATAAHLLPVLLGASPTPHADLGNDPARKKKHKSHLQLVSAKQSHPPPKEV